MNTYDAATKVRYVNGKEYISVDIPFFIVYMDLKVISSYRFRETMKNEYKAVLDYNGVCPSSEYLFENMDDVKHALDWINSIMVMNKLVDEEDNCPQVDIDFQGMDEKTREYIKKKFGG